MNQELEKYLRLFISQRQDDWKPWLSMAEFSYNSKIQVSTQASPFMVNLGFNPRMGIEPVRRTKVEAASEFAERMKKIHEEAQAALVKAQEDMTRYADQRRAEAPKYAVGDKVWLSTENLKINRPSRKLSERQLGPYTITKIINENVVKLRLPKKMRIRPEINVKRLRPYVKPMEGQVPEPAPPVEIEGEVEHEVEAIIDSRLYRGKLEFLVKWEGYTDEENTWEPEANVEHAKEAVKDFYKKHPSAPRRISMAIFKDLTFKTYENDTEMDDNNLKSRLEVEI
jgi:hypothetical protein